MNFTALFLFACPLLFAAPVFAAGGPTDPVPQRGMESRHERKVALAKGHRYGMLMIGDSITQSLEKPEYAEVWKKYYAPYDALGLGYSGGRTENTLWNLTHGELDNQAPKVITLLIGTNNSDDANYPVVHTPEQIFEGTKAIVNLLREKCPEAKIIVLRIFPRTNVYKRKDGSERGDSKKRFETNRLAGELTAGLADDKHVFWLDVNAGFMESGGALDPKLMPDMLHPSPAGAEVWAKAMAPLIAKLAGEKPASK